MTVVDWLTIGQPLTLVVLPLTWLILTRVGFPSRLGPIEGGRENEQEIRKLGPLAPGERVTLAVFAVTVLLWLTRPWLARSASAISPRSPARAIR